mmetsp:Transcript_851/g.1900  ORF Transcript_851/g.1900 Transcript_851/m.1900 type:complete len:275 (-) Transcript_851:23-847(-)
MICTLSNSPILPNFSRISSSVASWLSLPMKSLSCSAGLRPPPPPRSSRPPPRSRLRSKLLSRGPRSGNRPPSCRPPLLDLRRMGSASLITMERPSISSDLALRAAFASLAVSKVTNPNLLPFARKRSATLPNSLVNASFNSWALKYGSMRLMNTFRISSRSPSSLSFLPPRPLSCLSSSSSSSLSSSGLRFFLSPRSSSSSPLPSASSSWPAGRCCFAGADLSGSMTSTSPPSSSSPPMGLIRRTLCAPSTQQALCIARPIIYFEDANPPRGAP